jgi:hypothetical protein
VQVTIQALNSKDNETIDDKRIYFYTYWKTVPAIKEVSGEDKFELGEQAVRKLILKILREGQEDSFGKENKLPKRHVFTGRELADMINAGEEMNKELKLPNILFHLDKLIAADMVKIVDEVKEGKTKVRYFGRTAKLFLFNDPKELQAVKQAALTPIIDLMQYFNPNLTKTKIQEKLKEMIDNQLEYNDQVKLWIEQNHEVIAELNIDVLNLFDIMTKIGGMHPGIQEISKEIASLLKFTPKF